MSQVIEFTKENIPTSLTEILSKKGWVIDSMENFDGQSALVASNYETGSLLENESVEEFLSRFDLADGKMAAYVNA